jgi:hypothetical protein
MTISMVQLQSLARERLPGKRHELLRALTDGLFEPEHELSMKERELFDDIVERVLDDIEPLARQELAERLASRADAPHRVVVRLAGDIIAVASPVLMHSPVLLDDDLAPLASAKSQDHLLAISRRTQLSPRITDILVDRGDAIVLHTVAGNLGARFSGPGGAIPVVLGDPAPAPPPPPVQRRRYRPAAAGLSGDRGRMTEDGSVELMRGRVQSRTGAIHDGTVLLRPPEKGEGRGGGPLTRLLAAGDPLPNPPLFKRREHARPAAL